MAGRPSRPRFSVVVIARNEAHTLPRLLGSLAAFAARGGETLVVDTGSTDGTAALARAHDCRVEEVGSRFASALGPEQAGQIERRFAKEGEGPLVEPGQRLFHFGDAREHAGRLASNDMVLQLDASDEVLAFDLPALDRRLAAPGAGALEYGLALGELSLTVTRFYDRRLHRWEGRTHEVLVPTGAAWAPPRVRCGAHELAVRHHKDEGKPRAYLAGLALDAIAHPGGPRPLHYLGRELYYQRRYRSAIAVLEEHAAMEGAWSVERSQSLCLAGECLEALDRPAEAAARYLRAAVLDATRREPLLRLAELSCRGGDFATAVAHARAALAILRTSSYPELDTSYTWRPHALLYWSLFWLGRHEEARVHWETCRRLAPAHPQWAAHARLFPDAARANREAVRQTD